MKPEIDDVNQVLQQLDTESAGLILRSEAPVVQSCDFSLSWRPSESLSLSPLHPLAD